MDKPDLRDITRILRQLTSGNADAASQLLNVVYPELRRLAATYFKNEPKGHLLEPTALVHEAYIKLIDQRDVEWDGRTHFFSVGALAMRRILVDYARQNRRKKRSGQWKQIELEDDVLLSRHNLDDVMAVEDALCRLAELDDRQAKIVEMRFFGGLSVDQVAVAMGLSKRTVEAEWTMAKAWLRIQLCGESS
jgi:RNA polymerase sigma factor (TIGR02999 family)